MKRGFDIIVSFLGLVVLCPLVLLVAVAIKLDSPGPIFFRQERIGRGFRAFFIFKFRTMAQDSIARGQSITVGDDPRITRVGWFLRKTKIDELPQLINVLRGEMTFVGPRLRGSPVCRALSAGVRGDSHRPSRNHGFGFSEISR